MVVLTMATFQYFQRFICIDLVTMVLTGASMQTKLPTINQMAFSAPPGVTAGKMKPGTQKQNFIKLLRGRA